MKAIKNVKKLTAKAVSKASCKAAESSASTACACYLYEPKTPKALKMKKG